MHFLTRTIYWLAVIAISVVLLVLLVRFFESRDEGQVGSSLRPVPVAVL